MPARPNMALNRTRNGKGPWPGSGGEAHCPPPGQGPLPLRAG